MTQRLVCVVEGRGEVEAVPNLCARILQHLERWNWSVDQFPVKHPRSALVDQRAESPNRPCHSKRYAAAVELARARPAHAVLVLCDADDDCPVSWQISTVALAKRHKSWPPVAAVMAVREYEGWLLSNETDARLASIGVSTPENVRGAKEKLAALYVDYTPTTHQLALTRGVDISRLRARSRSFEKLVRAIGAMCP